MFQHESLLSWIQSPDELSRDYISDYLNTLPPPTHTDSRFCSNIFIIYIYIYIYIYTCINIVGNNNSFWTP